MCNAEASSAAFITIASIAIAQSSKLKVIIFYLKY
jgi:hypothetical protein